MSRKKISYEKVDQTSPIFEDAPVMSTTFPATFILNTDLDMNLKILNSKIGGEEEDE